MSRPKKQTVDYFAHVVKPGKTLFILERKFGNDGYSFWFKLLEVLGATDGHSYDINPIENREYLWAYCNVSEETGIAILKACVDMDAIDSELHSKGIIWSDNFVSNLAHLYSKRTSELPVKPVSDTETLVLGDGNPHSIVKDSIVKQSKVKEKNISCPNSLSLAGLLADLILIHSPQHRELTTSKRESTLLRWGYDIDLMQRVDKRIPSDIEEVIRFSQADTFWSQNILSGSKLRKQYDQLKRKSSLSGHQSIESNRDSLLNALGGEDAK